MKYYEIVIGYTKNSDEVNTNDSKNQTFDKIDLREGKYQQDLISPNFENGERRMVGTIISNLNSELMKGNSENDAAFVYWMCGGELKLIVRLNKYVNTIKEYAGGLYKKLNNYFQNKPFDDNYMDSEFYINLTNIIHYSEISSFDFFVEKIGYFKDQVLFNSDDTWPLIKEYMKKMKLYDYSINDLCNRYASLNLDFINTYEIGTNLSKDELMNEYKDLMHNEDFVDEINRIYDTGYKEKTAIIPVHYKIIETDKQIRQRYYECLGKALYSNGRVKNRIAMTFKISTWGMSVSPQSFKLLIDNSKGSFVSVEIMNEEEVRHGVWNFKEYPMKYMTDVLRNCKDSIQYIFNFAPYTEKVENAILESMTNVPILEIRNEVNKDSIEKIARVILKEQNLSFDDELSKRIKMTDGKLSINKLNNIIEDWKTDKVIENEYPEYAKFVKREENVCKYEDPYQELMSLVGLNTVKTKIDEIIMNAKLDKIKNEKFIEEKKQTVLGDTNRVLTDTLHMAFLGNPGTAKTTVAKLFARILYQKGIIRSPKTIMFNLNDTPKNCQKAFEEARGGVLFIDEAYQYIGYEFLADLVECLETYRNEVIVIFAGYKYEMKHFIASNTGLESRIKYKIEFEDYDEDELWQILLNMLKKMNLKLNEKDVNDIKEKLMPVFGSSQVEEKFGNGRLVRNILDTAKAKMAVRIMKDKEHLQDKSYDELTTLTLDDFDIDFKMLTGKTILPYVKDPSKELENYIGLAKVKNILNKILYKAKMDKLRNDKLNANEKTLIKSPMHLAFIGNPGTGKTSVARLFAKILKQKGIIKKSNIVEVGRKNLIGDPMISTSKVISAVFESARGGILFIDEAYSLIDAIGQGEEAINAIVQEMENRRDEVIVILGGYKDRMESFITRNEGMKSRISYVVEFEDYNQEELFKIFEKTICDNDLKLDKGVNEFIKKEIARIVQRDDYKLLGNARLIRKIVEKSKLNKDYRLGKLDKEEYTDDELKTIIISDLQDAINDTIGNKDDKITFGFAA